MNNQTSKLEDDDSVLDISEQYNRPINEPIHQQRVNAWHPILDPVWVIIALFYLSIILIPSGYKIQELANEIVELKVTYDPHPVCGIGAEVRKGTNCTVTFIPERNMNPPILLHYEIENFHQNHRNYYQSRDPYQLLGSMDPQDSVYKQRCAPLNTLGDISLYPCGLIANTLFNDIFTLIGGRSARTIDDPISEPLVLIEDGIAWSSDVEYMYKQPEEFCYEPCPQTNNDEENCDLSCCEPSVGSTNNCINNVTAGETDKFEATEIIPWSCLDKNKGPFYDSKNKFNATHKKCYRYYYPNENTTQYLYETYPEVVNPLEGVTNEHFMVWMRVATLPKFRKLYGYINQPIAAKSKVTFNITSNFVVETFGGKKSLILSTNNIFGGKTYEMANTFIGVGFFCLLSGIFFALKHILRPRRIGDRRYLHYKEE